MNRAHALICSSRWWAGTVEQELIPWGLAGVDLGEDVLEIGPGFGATTQVLAERGGASRRLTVIELDPRYCAHLRRTLPDHVEILQGDASDMPFEDGRFSGVVCFTMLHHLPSPELQDRLLGEVARVLCPGGFFAGTDSLGTGALFKLIHIGDTLVRVPPEGLPGRLLLAGLSEPRVEQGGRSLRFRARKAPQAA